MTGTQGKFIGFPWKAATLVPWKAEWEAGCPVERGEKGCDNDGYNDGYRSSGVH